MQHRYEDLKLTTEKAEYSPKLVETALDFHARNHTDLGIMSNNGERYGQSQHYRHSAKTDSNFFISPPFKFIVGGTSFYIHASIISQHSKPLERMINGHMAEAQQGFAVLKDVDEGTFIRFAQWAYHESNSGAEYEREPDNNQEEFTPSMKKDRRFAIWSKVEDLQQDDEDEDGLLAPSMWHPQKISKKRHTTGSSSLMRPIRQDLKQAFLERKCTIGRNTISTRPPQANKDPTEDYASVFLSHARLYVFAEQYDIQPLKNLALEELQLSLASYNLNAERTGDIISLLRYIYANTRESVAGVEDPRTLLTAYLGYEMDTLMEDKAFEELMSEDGGALLGDFVKAVKKRI